MKITCCSVPSCAGLCCAVRCRAVLCRAVLYYALPFHARWHHILQHLPCDPAIRVILSRPMILYLSQLDFDSTHGRPTGNLQLMLQTIASYMFYAPLFPSAQPHNLALCPTPKLSPSLQPPSPSAQPQRSSSSQAPPSVSYRTPAPPSCQKPPLSLWKVPTMPLSPGCHFDRPSHTALLID